jgi:hypothetical protein
MGFNRGYDVTYRDTVSSVSSINRLQNIGIYIYNRKNCMLSEKEDTNSYTQEIRIRYI